MTSIAAAVSHEVRRTEVRELPRPDPTSEAGLLRVELCGVCGSDWPYYLSYPKSKGPLILGHEAVGRIVQPGRSGLATGTRVVIEPNIPCGTCEVCLRGLGHVCPRKRSLGLNAPGAFAERVAVPGGFVHPVPAEVAPRDAVGLEPLAVAVRAVRLGGAAAGDPVAVVGCGNEGLLVVQVAAAMGARVLAVDRRAEMLRTAEQLGASRTLQVLPDETPAATGARLAAEWAPLVVFECAGVASAVEVALQAPAAGGRVVLVGLAPRPVPLLPLHFVRRGLSLVGSLIYDHPQDFLQAIELVRSGRVQPRALAAHVYPLEQAALALERVAAGGTGKTVLDIGGVLTPESDRPAAATTARPAHRR